MAACAVCLRTSSLITMEAYLECNPFFSFYTKVFCYCQTSCFFKSNYSFHFNNTVLEVHVFLPVFVVIIIITIIFLPQDLVTVTKKIAKHQTL
jgi:hypothetical protein